LASVDGGDQLAEGITIYAQECVACHGPDGTGSSLAPALNDPAVREMTDDDLSRIITMGIPGTLMAPWENNLEENELDALLTLLARWDEVPAGAIPAPDRPIPVTEESLALGADLYASSCSTCHGPDGQGTRRAPALNVKSFLTDTLDAAIEQIITLGVPGTAMPAWGDRMTEAQIQAIVGYIRAWELTAPEVAEPARGGGGPWWQSEGGTTPGGTKGGPPWMRNSDSTQGSQSLPGGAVSQNSASITTNLTANQSQVVNEGQSTIHQAGISSNGQQGNGLAGNSQSDGGGPPWAQEQSQQVVERQPIDWRPIGLITAMVVISLIMIGISVISLRRLGREIRI